MNNSFNNIDLFLFDMDGTLYLGDRLFDFTIDLLQKIREKGKSYLFITNNSSKSVEDYVVKLRKMGVNATENDFLTSSQATSYYLKKHHREAILYVCGTESLKTELKNNGFTISEDLNQVNCIVMGFDTELTFKKLHDVSYLLSTRDLPYIATNPDYVCPTSFGSVPDCGSVCDMIFNATGKRPLVIGKPEPLMIQLACEKMNVSSENTAVIGDRIYTDVMSGKNAGALSVLVMSGETTERILEESEQKPDVVLSSAKDIIDLI